MYILCRALSIAIVIFWSQFSFANCEVSPLSCKKSAIKNFSEFNLDQYAKWNWLSGYEFSGLHWNQFISVYTNIGAKEYKNNYTVFINSLLDDEDDEDEDEDEEDSDDSNSTRSSYMSYPVGTVFVKENYQSEGGKPGQLLSVTVMAKHPQGFDDAGGNWEYLQFSAQGGLLFRGHSEAPAAKAVCANCHMNVKERDSVFSTVLSSSLE